jgi:hypothetical protein
MPSCLAEAAKIHHGEHGEHGVSFGVVLGLIARIRPVALPHATTASMEK